MREIVLTVHTFKMGTAKEAAIKVLEEASETRAAWQALDLSASVSLSQEKLATDLADEIADCIQACCNLASRYDIDLSDAMERCEARNRERGRL